MFTQVNLRLLNLFYREIYGLNKQIYFRVAVGWASLHAQPLIGIAFSCGHFPHQYNPVLNVCIAVNNTCRVKVTTLNVRC